MKIFAIDIGNSNSVLALIEGDKIVDQWRIQTMRYRTSDEYELLIKELAGELLQDVEKVVISTVVPQSLYDIKQAIGKLFSCKILIIDRNEMDLPISINMKRPDEVGADRLVNAIAAFARFKTSCLMIDFGTATTFDIVSKKGEYEGGAIAPGVQLSIDALHNAAAKLPHIAIKRPSNIVGKSTVEAMQSGLFYGYLSMIEGMIERFKSEYDIEHVIATGGLAALFAPETNQIDEIIPDLTLEGLAIIAESI